jgi:hypothetical protein
MLRRAPVRRVRHAPKQAGRRCGPPDPALHGPRPCGSSLRRICNRALTIPWAGQERHASAGLLAHGSSRGTNLPRPRMILRPAQWLHPDALAGCACIALAAHSCRDSPVSDRAPQLGPNLTMFPIKPLRAPVRVEGQRQGRCLRAAVCSEGTRRRKLKMHAWPGFGIRHGLGAIDTPIRDIEALLKPCGLASGHCARPPSIQEGRHP